MKKISLAGWNYIFIILLSCLPLVHMFLFSGIPHTSDGAMHAVRFTAYYKELLAGQIPVRWASQLGYGYGTPLFVFFNPLAYIIGAGFLAIGISVILTLKISFALTYILAGVFTLLFARAYFKDKKTAFFVAVMYQYAPFRLVEMLVRGNLGSLYSYTILPLVLYAVISLVEKKRFSYWYFTLISVSIALLPLSHTIIGFIFFALAFPFVLLFSKSIRKIIVTYVAMFVGLLLSAFFWIPAIIEHKYTNGYLFTKDLFYNHFPSLYKFLIPNFINLPQLRTAEVPVQIGIFHELAFFMACFLLFKKKFTGKVLVISYFIVVSLITLLFMQPVTKVIWENVSMVRQFQFPWRFLAIICFTTSVLSGFVIQKVQFLRKKLIYGLLIFLTVTTTVVYWAPYQGYQKFTNNYFWNFPGSTNYFAEINTIWMEHEPVAFPKNRVEVISGKAAISGLSMSSMKHTFVVKTEKGSSIVDRTIFFPGWKVKVDNKNVPIEFQDQHYRGLITFTIPPGKHIVQVYRTEDQVELISDVISFITFIGIIFATMVVIYKKIHAKNN